MMKEPIPACFQETEVDPHLALHCPACDYNSLHQGVVTVFTRRVEGGPSDAVVVDGTDVQFVHGATVNPSPEREGLTVKFECEGCRSELELCLIQDQGGTYMYWSHVVPIPADDDDCPEFWADHPLAL